MNDTTNAHPEGGPTPAEASTYDVVRALEFDIVFGGLRPRERLVEDVLIARFGVKRHVVRSALAKLERMGIVVRLPHRGATVRDFSAQEVEEIYDIRELLQQHAVDRMAMPGDPAHVERLTEIQRRHNSAVQAGDLRAVDQVNDLFHREFFSACRSTHLAEAISHYSQITRAMRIYPIAYPVALGVLQREHWGNDCGAPAGDRASLLKLVAQHLQPSKTAYLRVRRSMDGAAKQALETGHNLRPKGL